MPVVYFYQMSPYKKLCQTLDFLPKIYYNIIRERIKLFPELAVSININYLNITERGSKNG